MLHKNRLFTPGPTPLLPAAQTAMASFTAHHRTADFRALFQRVLADMKEFIGTQNDVLVLACSGTGVMEASVSNLTSPGDKVLVLTAGKFGERWTGLAKAFGCTVDVLTAPYGETFSLDDIRAKLTPDVRAVFVQATESSTGARHDVEGIAKIVRANGRRHAAGGGCDHRPGHDPSRRGWLGRGCDYRRIAEGADDPSRPRVLRGERAGVAADGDDDFSALLLRPAQRAQSRRPRANLPTRRRLRCLRRWERRWSLSAAWAMAIVAKGREALVDNAELCAAMTRAGAQAVGIEALRHVACGGAHRDPLARRD